MVPWMGQPGLIRADILGPRRLHPCVTILSSSSREAGNIEVWISQEISRCLCGSQFLLTHRGSNKAHLRATFSLCCLASLQPQVHRLCSPSFSLTILEYSPKSLEHVAFQSVPLAVCTYFQFLYQHWIKPLRESLTRFICFILHVLVLPMSWNTCWMVIGLIQFYLVTSHLARTLSSSSVFVIYSICLNIFNIM